MIESARNKALMEELAAVKTRQEEFFSNQTNQYNMIRKEQNLLGKEILDVKKHQMNTVTMGSSSSPNKYEPDQALIKIREQHANFSEVQRQLKEWTKNSSARECYSVWAHQQANPNLVEMPVHKVTKQIYDNTNNNRLMFGMLLIRHKPDPTTPRQPLIKSRRGQQLCLSTLRRRNPRICVDRHSSASEQAEPTPKRDPGSLGVAQTSSTTSRVHA
ncbi:hypothetical protein PIB30_099020 [Stylosanthes scabra]|uniref:Uncharacterized protein n=1 Tax=Stylosanthes scabra TaxID=79078 RepID=A0ABU6XTI6_9FABA|nr:hypothetical protein [Stylosanthes scabra]